LFPMFIRGDTLDFCRIGASSPARPVESKRVVETRARPHSLCETSRRPAEATIADCDCWGLFHHVSGDVQRSVGRFHALKVQDAVDEPVADLLPRAVGAGMPVGESSSAMPRRSAIACSTIHVTVWPLRRDAERRAESVIGWKRKWARIRLRLFFVFTGALVRLCTPATQDEFSIRAIACTHKTRYCAVLCVQKRKRESACIFASRAMSLTVCNGAPVAIIGP
jgi:hypothetical protein